jgi:hypothetical protein
MNCEASFALMLMVMAHQSVRWLSNASFQAQKSIRNPKLLHLRNRYKALEE